MEYEVVIGLEVHAQLKTATKIFCGCSAAKDYNQTRAAPNTHICPVCLGMPGVLPVLNKQAAVLAIKAAAALNCQIQPQSRFARKNYFYPDLPKGYQISQYEMPVALNGIIAITVSTGTKQIGIHRIHLEEDAGKLIHDPGRSYTKVDFNRTGIPLIEIVSEPDMRSPEEAGAYLRKLHAILRYIDVCDGNMEEGDFRCDANVSIMPRGSQVFGVRTEIKNLNSFKNVEKALEFEIVRQQRIINEGGHIIQETRQWDADQGVALAMRGKEEAHDYRYFPDPDLVPLVVSEQWIEQIRAQLPELPDAKKQRFAEEYGLPIYDCELLTGSRALADYFELCLQTFPHPKTVSNWMMGALLGMLNQRGITIEQSPVSPENFAKLLDLVQQKVINATAARTVLDDMADSGQPPDLIVKQKELSQVSDADLLATIVKQVIAEYPKEAAAYRQGKTKLMGFFVGQVMKQTRGKANPQLLNELFRENL